MTSPNLRHALLVASPARRAASGGGRREAEAQRRLAERAAKKRQVLRGLRRRVRSFQPPLGGSAGAKHNPTRSSSTPHIAAALPTDSIVGMADVRGGDERAAVKIIAI